jgi:hypothetical protein
MSTGKRHPETRNERRASAIVPREYAPMVAQPGSSGKSCTTIANDIKTAERSKNLSITTEINEDAKLYSDQRERTNGRTNSPSRKGKR